MPSRGNREPRTLEVRGATYFRWADYDVPFWAGPNTYAARWHEQGDDATQYLSGSPNGAWAEKVRHEDLTTEEEIAQIRSRIWAARITLQAIVDYSKFEYAEEAGFPADALIDDDRRRCRTEGGRLRRLGYAGVLAPSAALLGVTNLTVFGPRMRSSWLREPSLRSSIPACVVAIGAPAPGLAHEVRRFGDVHAAFEMYAAPTEAGGGHPPTEDGESPGGESRLF